METLKQLIFNRYRIFYSLSVSIAFSIVLLMIRMKLTNSDFYLFLVWNLFLAIIPFAITTYIASKPKLHKIGFVLWFALWLLFLPNAPYIITDLLHLKISTNKLLWLDILVISNFAISGLLLFLFSLLDMEILLKKYTNKSKLIVIPLFFLNGFGVYLGRFLRYNSWELFQNPTPLFNDILNIILHPSKHTEAWLFTLLFGAFLYFAFWMFKSLLNIKNE